MNHLSWVARSSFAVIYLLQPAVEAMHKGDIGTKEMHWQHQAILPVPDEAPFHPEVVPPYSPLYYVSGSISSGSVFVSAAGRSEHKRD